MFARPMPRPPILPALAVSGIGASRFSSPASPATTSRQVNTPAPNISLPPTEIIPRLYISDLAAAEHGPTLAHYGITHVVSAMCGTVALPTMPSPLQWLQLPLLDSPFAELAEHLPRAVQFIADALQDPRTRVLVHCVQGVSRSSSVVCAYLIRAYGWSPTQSLQYVKSKRSTAEPNPGFISQLEEFAESSRAGNGGGNGSSASSGGRRK